MTDTHKTRLTLLERLRDQYDEAAWEEFTDTYKNYIYVVIVRMGFNSEDTEDLHQQVLMKLWKHLPDFTYDRNRRFRSWIATVTVNVCKDYLRSVNNKKNSVDMHDLETHYGTIKLPEIEEIAEKEWELFITNTALQNIRPSFNGPSVDVFCEFMNGATAEDIAYKYGLRKNTAYQMKARVREKMIQEVARLRAELE